VRDPARELHLAPEAIEDPRGVHEIAAQHLERDDLVELDVAGAVHAPHAAHADEPEQLVPIGEQLTGWVATGPTPTKRAHLAASPHVSVNYWAPSHDTCVAECRAALVVDDATRRWLWDHFEGAPAPVGYDPALIPAWTSPTAPTFAALRLDPWRLRVFPGSGLMGKGGTVLTWREAV